MSMSLPRSRPLRRSRSRPSRRPRRRLHRPKPKDEGEQSTRQFTALEAEEAQRPPPADAPSSEDDEVHDELEETPDFLQETPDHDRLWFEQKPPRDFDF